MPDSFRAGRIHLKAHETVSDSDALNPFTHRIRLA